MNDSSYIVVDVETTGLSKYRHAITEIAALKYSNGKITDEFVTLVNPKREIPRFITKLTGIDNDMVKDKPTIDEVIPSFLDFLGNDVFVGHNAGFDFNFLDYATYAHVKTNIKNPILCTCKLARRLLPELPSKSLGNLCTHFQINNEQAHRAKSDVLATISLMEIFFDLLKKQEIKEVNDILTFPKSKIPKMY